MRKLLEFILVFIIMVTIDYCWLGIFARDYYHNTIGSLMRINEGGNLEPIWISVLTVYITMSLCLLYFVLNERNSIKKAFIKSANFGAVLYGTYEFTNYAILKSWPLDIIAIDILWGTFLMAITASISACKSELRLSITCENCLSLSSLF